MSDKAYERMIEVPGMKLAYHIPINGEGRQISVEMALDQTIDTNELHERLEVIRQAADRQNAWFYLPIAEKRLAQNEARLAILQRSLAYEVGMEETRRRNAEAAASARGRERRVVEMGTGTPGQNIVNIENSIKATITLIEEDRMEIPILKAICRGEPRPAPKADLVEPIAIVLEAAE